MKKRKIKKFPFIITIMIIILIFIISFKIDKTIKYHNTYDYKLLQLNYTEKEIKNIKKLSDKKIDEILKKDKIEILSDIIAQKYFLEKNLDTYINYYNENKDKKLNDIIAIVNVGANNEPYSNTKKADTTKNELILVNKYYYLDNTFIPEGVIDAPLSLAFDDNQTTELVLEKFKEMALAADEEDLTLIINSGYRPYEYQEELYSEYEARDGVEGADSYAARPGHSEHQTGLAIDIITYGAKNNSFDQTDEFKWLDQNAHKYGFILRYPKDKTYLTGYDYESWHFRYVGIDAATKIKKLGITFDEYYAYFIENK